MVSFYERTILFLQIMLYRINEQIVIRRRDLVKMPMKPQGKPHVF